MPDDLPRHPTTGQPDAKPRQWIDYAAVAVACPVCHAEAEHDCHNEIKRHAPHWARVAAATVSAAEEARRGE